MIPANRVVQAIPAFMALALIHPCAQRVPAQPVFAVAAFQKIKQVVDEIGVNLHQKRKQKAKQGRR